MTIDPTGRTAAVPAQDAPMTTPVWSAPVRRHRTSAVVWASVGIVVGALSVLLVLVYLASFLGAAALGICLLLALIPLTLVILAVRWVDRWEPEPHPALWFAFLWGAGVSIVSALVFDLGVQIVSAVSGTASIGGDVMSAVVQAPLVEEVAKGFGLLLLFWVIRSQFHGPIDGVVYAAVIAAGFAFSENIQYFGVAMLEGGLGALGVTFLLRGVLSPFAHVLFTACTGFALGLAARRATGSGYIGLFLAGLVAAVLLHALWNGAFFVLSTDASLLGYYLLVQVPLFLGAILTVLFLRRHEEKLTVQRLGDYAAVGWFTAAEVQMLATGRGRRQALAWAHAQPTSRRLAMNRFIVDATRLASVRHRLIAGQDKPVHAGSAADHAEEARLLGLLMADRAEILR
jgi:RsiW-degrading membrane proteinase PrsW (M82 family)